MAINRTPLLLDIRKLKFSTTIGAILAIFLLVFLIGIGNRYKIIFINGESVLVSVGIAKLHNNDFNKGDYISFIFPYEDIYGFKDKTLIKKVVCSEGDYLTSEGRHFYCNGKYLVTAKERDKKGRTLSPFVYNGKIDKGLYFVIGDNDVHDSYDSRYWGFVKKEWITGKITPILTKSSSYAHATDTPDGVVKFSHIEIPNSCVKFEKIEGEKVYLKNSSNQCSQVVGKLFIEIPNNIKKVKVFIDGKYWNEQSLEDKTVSSEQSVIDRVKDLKKNKEELQEDTKKLIEKNKFTEEGQKKAKEWYDYYKSSEYQTKLEKEKQRILKDNFGYNNQKQEKDKRKDDTVSSIGSTERVYIFMSSSVPVATWNAYAEAIEKINSSDIRMLIRGCIGEKGCTYIKPTVDFLQSIIAPDPQNPKQMFVDIDPLLFRKYRITRVPAIVYAKNVNVISEDISEGLEENLKGSPTYYVIYGDVSLRYALGRIYDKTKSQYIKGVIAALDKSFYKE